MECNCNTYNEAETQFLDINGVSYLLSVLDVAVTKRMDNKIATIPVGMDAFGEDDFVSDDDIDSIFTTGGNA